MIAIRWALRSKNGKFVMNAIAGAPRTFRLKKHAQAVATYYKAKVVNVFVSVQEVG